MASSSEEDRSPTQHQHQHQHQQQQQQPPLLLPLLDDTPSTSIILHNHDEEQQPSPQPTFHDRPFRDLPCLLLFLLLYLFSLSLGLFSLLRPNASAPSSCSTSTTNTSSSSHSSFTSALATTLALTLVLSPPIAFSLLCLLRRHPRHLAYLSFPLLPILLTLLNAYWFAACTLSPSCRSSFSLPLRLLALLAAFLPVALIAWLAAASWRRVDLAAGVVRVASATLAANLGLLLPTLPLLGLACAAPIVAAIALAPRNGALVPMEEEEEGAYGCTWRQEWWVSAYMALGIITVLWVLAAVVEAQTYVIAGTVARWYFAEDGEKPPRSIRSSLSHAFGRSFGTVCFSGLTIGFVPIVRGIVDAAEREEGDSGIVNCLLQCCANKLLSGIHFINKFAINFAAITGEACCSSARMTYELLKRNLLSAASVEAISTRILVGIIFVVSTIYAIVVCTILKAVAALGAEAYLIAVLAWALLIVVLGFFVHILDSVLDTLYICYAIDRDKGEVTKQEVHEVYAHLPISRAGRPSLAIRRPLLV